MSTDEMSHYWYTIVNPNAGEGKGKKDWYRIADLFKKRSIPITVKFTEKKNQAIEFAREAVIKGYRKIIAVGGDGTLHEVINGIFTQGECSPRQVSVGMIPVGTGNDWGKMFSIPLIYEGAVDVIKENKLVLHDIGIIKYHDGDKQEKRYFINIAGLGYEALVVKKTNRQKEKGRSSQAIYLLNLLSSLVMFRNTKTEIVIDDKPYSGKIFSINIGNGRYCGGGMRQTPEALPDDGLLDITVIREMGRIEILKSLKILYDGTILSHPKIDGFRAKNIRVQSESLLYAEADGESLGHTPVEVSIIPGAVNVVYGEKII